MTSTVTVRPKTLDLSLYAGDSFSLLFIFADATTGDPWPLTGTWAAQVRSDDVLVAEFTVDTALGADGKLSLSLTGEQTAELDLLGGMLWDLQQDFAGGPRTWYRGNVNVTSDITHA